MTSPANATSSRVFDSAPTEYNGNLKYSKQVLTGLGIAEVAVGSISIIISCVLLGYVYGPDGFVDYYDAYTYSYYIQYIGFNTGEGVWCGVWILVGGALGIASGRKQPSLCLFLGSLSIWVLAHDQRDDSSLQAFARYHITSQFAFSIVGAIFGFFLSGLGILTAVVNISSMAKGLGSLLAISGLVALCLCITSAFCCRRMIFYAGLQDCCGSCCMMEQTPILGATHTRYMATPQHHHQAQQGQQATYSGNNSTFTDASAMEGEESVRFDQQQASAPMYPQHQENESKQQEAGSSFTPDGSVPHPPPYYNNQ